MGKGRGEREERKQKRGDRKEKLEREKRKEERGKGKEKIEKRGWEGVAELIEWIQENKRIFRQY